MTFRSRHSPSRHSPSRHSPRRSASVVATSVETTTKRRTRNGPQCLHAAATSGAREAGSTPNARERTRRAVRACTPTPRAETATRVTTPPTPPRVSRTRERRGGTSEAHTCRTPRSARDSWARLRPFRRIPRRVPPFRRRGASTSRNSVSGFPSTTRTRRACVPSTRRARCRSDRDRAPRGSSPVASPITARPRRRPRGNPGTTSRFRRFPPSSSSGGA